MLKFAESPRALDFSKAINTFFFAPASAQPLALFRIGLAGLLLWQAFLMRTSFSYFLSRMGFIQGEMSTTLSDPFAPHVNWLLDPLVRFGVSETTALSGFGLLYVVSLLSLLCGSFTRSSAFIVWFLHWSFINTSYSGSYGADMYAHMFLFYLVWIPSGDNLSVDRLLGRVSGEPSYQARFGLRMLQLHMCISYLASGLEKATGEQWWNGDVIWIAINTPGYSIADFHWLARMPVLPMVGGWIVMAIEIFYCVFMWPRRTRTLWIALTCALHLGIALFLKLHIFGVLMCIPTLTLFAISSERRVGERKQKSADSTNERDCVAS